MLQRFCYSQATKIELSLRLPGSDFPGDFASCFRHRVKARIGG